MVNITIDGKKISVKEGTTILEAAKQNGINHYPFHIYHNIRLSYKNPSALHSEDGQTMKNILH